MTAADLDALDKLRGAATAGEWSRQENRIYARGYRVATVVLGGKPADGPADAALIVAAVNALPDLIAEARKYRALREAVEADERSATAIAAAAWSEGYESCRRGEQKRNPYRAVVATVDGDQ